MLATDDNPRRRNCVGLAGFLAIEIATFVRYTDIVILGCAVMAVTAAWRLQAARLPLRTLCAWPASVAAFGAGVTIFDELVYGGPLTTGYQPGEVTFALGAIGPNLRIMPADLVQAMPMHLFGLIALAWIIVRWLVLRRAGGQPGAVARRDLSVGPPWPRRGSPPGTVLRVHLDDRPDSVTVQAVRLWMFQRSAAVSLCSALGLVTRTPGGAGPVGLTCSRRCHGDCSASVHGILPRHVRSVPASN